MESHGPHLLSLRIDLHATQVGRHHLFPRLPSAGLQAPASMTWRLWRSRPDPDLGLAIGPGWADFERRLLAPDAEPPEMLPKGNIPDDDPFAAEDRLYEEQVEAALRGEPEDSEATVS